MTSKKDDVKKGFEVSGELKQEKARELEFAFLKLKVRYLTSADKLEARRLSRKPGSSKKHPKFDEDLLKQLCASKAIVSFKHIDGEPLLNEGVELKNTPENIKILLDGVPGLDTFLFENSLSADQMYRTLSEQEIKN